MKGITALPLRAEVRNIPVTLNERQHNLAQACGIWPFKRIVINRDWFRLEAEEQAAVLMHECYHCERFHMEIRWLLVPIAWTRFAARIAYAQELAADAFAATQGYLGPLVSYLSKHQSADPGPFHPTPAARLNALLKGI